VIGQVIGIMPMTDLTINNEKHVFDGDPNTPLLWYLRDEIGLTGTRFGCGAALCGCCTVHVDGEAARSCSITMGDLGGKSIMTIEGLGRGGLHALQRAWLDIDVPQCGYCQSGQLMQAAALLTRMRTLRTRTSTKRCQATSAGAEPIRVSAKRSSRPRGN
jgi:isoquinoline 1-oxidoreductase subunit alpha